jgi:hypothetical protein
MNAPRKELKMIPVNIIVSTLIERSILRANASTKKIVAQENKMLSNGRVKLPIIGIDN